MAIKLSATLERGLSRESPPRYLKVTFTVLIS
jgi:hypothetical protein